VTNVHLALARVEAWWENSAAAKGEVAKLQSITLGRRGLTDSAVALALAGDNAGAQRLADALAKKYPMDTFVNTVDLPSIRAILATNRRNYDEAVRELEPARTYASKYSVVLYVRGRAYLRAAKGAEAGREFQKVIDNRFDEVLAPMVDPLVPLARLGLARAYLMQGDTANARTAYQDFLATWKDADPDIPILKQAKAEYARLR
jgi:tetratricopeptide (TPR) repeat protein